MRPGSNIRTYVQGLCDEEDLPRARLGEVMALDTVGEKIPSR